MIESREVMEYGSGIRLSVVVNRPDATGCFPCVVLIHGLGGHKDSPIFLDLVSRLCRLGIASVRFDFPGHGESGGTTRELTIGGAVDVLQAVLRNVAEDRPFVNGPLAAVGASFGGAVLLRAARHVAGLKAMVLRSPVSDYVAVRTAQLGERGLAQWERTGFSDVGSPSREHPTPFAFLEDARSHDVFAEAARTEVPLLIVHGGEDATVPVGQSRRLAAAWGQDAELIILASADHSMSDANSRRRFVLLASDFLRSALVGG